MGKARGEASLQFFSRKNYKTLESVHSSNFQGCAPSSLKEEVYLHSTELLNWW